ncbi:unnamed protein product [Toxocara canis]|uniref:Uncharacterized protein n=1 Tax=Toxocara canis TaxID=6265 RepID=A0A183V8N8_TOXCA|nr:unnamed protein product [Toxocara canis]
MLPSISWGAKMSMLSLLYLIALWSFIGLLCSLLMMCLFFISERQPLFYGRGSFIGGIPGISYEPLDRSSSASRVIKWSAGTTTYSQILHEYLKKYLHDGASRYVDCRNSSQMINSCASCECMSKTAPCDVNVSDNDDKNATLGFNEGAPCILLRVNKFDYSDLLVALAVEAFKVQLKVEL